MARQAQTHWLAAHLLFFATHNHTHTHTHSPVINKTIVISTEQLAPVYIREGSCQSCSFDFECLSRFRRVEAISSVELNLKYYFRCYYLIASAKVQGWSLLGWRMGGAGQACPLNPLPATLLLKVKLKLWGLNSNCRGRVRGSARAQKKADRRDFHLCPAAVCCVHHIRCKLLLKLPWAQINYPRGPNPPASTLSQATHPLECFQLASYTLDRGC